MANNIQKTKSTDFKVILLGCISVGKTCITKAFLGERFEQNRLPTLGIEFNSIVLSIDNNEIKLKIWDTAGQEKYNSITTSYYSNANGILLVFDVTSISSFERVNSWLNQIRDFAAKDSVIFLVGNKIDLVDKRTVSEAQAKEFALKNDIVYIETSAKSCFNITQIFFELSREMIAKKKLKNDTVDKDTEDIFSLEQTDSIATKTKCWCSSS